MNNSTYTETLIQMIDGELSGENLAAIEKKIAEDPAISEEYERLLAASEVVKSYGLRSRIGSLHREMMMEVGRGEFDASAAKKPATGNQPVIKMKTRENEDMPRIGATARWLRFSIRAAAAVLILLGSYTTYQYYNATPEKLFNENFSSFQVRQARGDQASPLFQAYSGNDMEKVISEYGKMPAPLQADDFIAGSAYLKSGQWGNAIRCFTALREKNKIANLHYYEEDVEYYLGMAYLGNHEPGKSLELFEKIQADPSHPYHDKVSRWFMIRVGRWSGSR